MFFVIDARKLVVKVLKYKYNLLLFSASFQKFVCTTIRPTQLPYKELYNWNGAAEFVADYLNFKPLDPSYELVRYL